MVKIRLQNQAKEFPGHRRSAFITFDRIWKSEGLRGLYRGVGVTAAGYLPTWAIYFSSYEWSKNRLIEEFGRWIYSLMFCNGSDG